MNAIMKINLKPTYTYCLYNIKKYNRNKNYLRAIYNIHLLGYVVLGLNLTDYVLRSNSYLNLLTGVPV